MAKVLMSRTVFILVLCVSDLVSEQLRYSIPEELEHGAFIGNIAENIRLNVWELLSRKFRLISDDPKQYMEVNPENGFLFVNERIDREEICRKSSPCSLSVQIALDNPLEMYPVSVEIQDVNDNAPIFPKREFHLHINELIAPGARFPLESAQDPDVGTNAISTYQISPNEHFAIKVQTRRGGSKSAELLLKKPLDREQQSMFTLQLTAIDGGTPHRSGTAQLIVNVMDGNDNAPIFDRETYRATVVENVANGTLVIKIHAADMDEGTNAEVTYSFTNHVSQNVRELFQLDPVTGEIRVQGVVDFEEANVYELDVQAVEHVPPGLAAHANVVVDVIDTNDNFPELHVTVVASAVREDAPAGTTIALISVTDADSDEYGDVHCQIPGNIPFKIENPLRNNYKLVTNGILDHELIPVYNISISAWDGGSPPLSTSKLILVSVTDINDNAPKFTKSSYNVYLMENNTPGASIFVVNAYDADLNQNGEISYSILDNAKQDMSSSAYVTINSKNGNIYALQSFDYEQLKHFQVNVQAHDAGFPPLSSTAIVNVIILDQNDNAPVILSPLTWNSSASVEIMPQSTYPGYLITKVIATDEDSGQNARLSFQVLEATDPNLFTVGILSGEIRAIRSVRDQEIITENLVLCVKDNGQPSLSSTATISFTIMSNVTEKSFERTDEPRRLEYFSDLNSYLIITLGSTSFLFLVTIIGLVILKYRQDRNIAEDYTSTGRCYSRRNTNDGFNRRQAASEPLNYSGSVQTEGYRYTVCLSPKSSKSDFLFLKPCHPTLPFNDVSVHDINNGRLQRVPAIQTDSLKVSNMESYFSKQTRYCLSEGRLFLFDDYLLLGIPAKAMANILSSWASFIFLLCISGLVSGQIRYSIPEELEYGAFVGNIADDLSLNAREISDRNFRLVSDSRKQYMEVNLENGNIFINERIDREQLCRQSPVCSLSFQILLEHPSEMHRAAVEVLDINDNSPSFLKDEYALRINELIMPGKRLPLESAHDPDVGTNAISNYQISPNEYFDLRVQTRNDGTKSAELLLQKTLDREQQSTFHLVLTATDGGIPHRSGTTRIVVNIGDANDNAPAFDSETYSTNILENTPKGTLVIKLNAVDLDEGTNAELTYSFTSHVSEKARELFTLDPINGEIKVEGLLDFEESPMYELDVEAVDKSEYPMAGHAKVMVGLIDMNDNAPEVEVTSISSTVPENAQSGTVVATISVRDADSLENGQIQCEVDVDIPFKFQKSFGNNYKIVTSGDLDRETTPLYNISITARDRGSPPLATSKIVMVSVSDVNDNPPRFTQSSYNVFVTENNTPSASIFSVSAADPDMDQNGEVSYFVHGKQIQYTSAPSYITINSKSGSINALLSFDYELLKNFQIIVQAQDAGSPPLSSTATVNVIILDQNDNAPIIVSPLTWNSSLAVEILRQSVVDF
ncbi:protocadherin gamma-A7-like [Mustelus asterias]